MLIARIAVLAYGPDISLHNIRSHKPTKKPEVRLSIYSFAAMSEASQMAHDHFQKIAFFTQF